MPEPLPVDFPSLPVAQLEARTGRVAAGRLPERWGRLRYLLGDDR